MKETSEMRRARKAKELARRKERFHRGEVDVPHGTLNAYNNYGCRCRACKDGYMQWASIYAASSRRPARKKLPAHLEALAAQVSLEVAELIKDQYADDLGRRWGYANRLSRYEIGEFG